MNQHQMIHSSGAGKMRISLPEGLSRSVDGPALILTKTWFAYRWAAPLILSLAWVGFFGAWYLHAVRANAPLASLLFPLLAAAAGLLVLYTCIAGLINKTSFRVEPGKLTVSHYPLPWPGAGEWAGSEIAQLFCSERISCGRFGKRVAYELNLATRNGRTVALIKGLECWDDAHYIEQEVEQYLGIRDQPMPGELG